ncbi:MAG: AraC family transcriptional regulator [Rhodospirillales bacterium]|jgi:AraC family transcriptional regulator|nr:AraC family transcriptional regulator [Rhodospirillales bacterium]
MPQSSQARVVINPGELAKRQAASWRGLDAEIVQFPGNDASIYEFRANAHLFIACQRASRTAGETHIEGLRPSTLRDFSRKMLFVPADHGFKGRFVPRIPLRTTYFYIDPSRLAVDPELDFSSIAFTPRLFFDDPVLWSTAEKLIALIESPGEGTRLYAEALGAVLAVELVRLERGTPGASTAATRGGLAGWQRRAACDYIEEHLAEDVALADLAAVAKLSPAHFCRAFKRSVGLPPHRYQLQRRIEQAKTLLADAETPVLNVALACGFGFSSNFTQAFRKVTGVTPREFRRGL